MTQGKQNTKQPQGEQKDTLTLAKERKQTLKDSGQYKDVYSVIVPKNNQGTDYYVAHIRKPEREELSAGMAQMETDPLGANEMILRTCWIEGDNEILEDDDVFMGAVSSLQNMMQVRQGFLLKG